VDVEARKKKIWALAIIGFFVLVSVLTFAYNDYYIYLSAYLWFGLIYGMCLQYGRFCFSSAFRDLFAVGVPRMVVGIMTATICFGFVASIVTASGFSTFHPSPSGIHSVIAGLIFGVGMVLAGGCASGSLYKAGEGNGVALLVILSISVTQSFLASTGGWLNELVPASWHASAVAKGLPASINAGDGWLDQYLAGYVWNHPTVTFAKLIGLKDATIAGAFVGNLILGVVIPATLLLVVVYNIWGKNSFTREWLKTEKTVRLRDHLTGFWQMLRSSKRTSIAGLVLGVACGRRPGSLTDHALMVVGLVGYSLPVFWLGQLLLMALSLQLGWFPTQGMQTIAFGLSPVQRALDVLHHLALPAITLATRYLALNVRLMRTSLVEVGAMDYLMTARAKGLAERVVIWKHAVRNALLPVVTIMGLNVGHLVGGAVLTETVFAWPGLGRLIFDSILHRDYPVLLGGLLVISVCVVIGNLLADLAYAVIDPRIRLGSQA